MRIRYIEMSWDKITKEKVHFSINYNLNHKKIIAVFESILKDRLFTQRRLDNPKKWPAVFFRDIRQLLDQLFWVKRSLPLNLDNLNHTSSVIVHTQLIYHCGSWTQYVNPSTYRQWWRPAGRGRGGRWWYSTLWQTLCTKIPPEKTQVKHFFAHMMMYVIVY